jgi:Flp pilus assembly protein CpaB
VVILAAISFGWVSSQSLASLSSVQDANPEANQKNVTILVAKKNLARYTVIKEPAKYFTVKVIPSSAAPKGCFHRLDEIKNLKLAEPIAEGECITKRHDFGSLSTDEQVARLFPGRIALTIYGQELTGVFRSTEKVNMIVVRNIGTEETEAEVIMRNVFVFTSAFDDRGLAQQVTLAVYPEQAAQIRFDMGRGELRLAYVRFAEE